MAAGSAEVSKLPCSCGDAGGDALALRARWSIAEGIGGGPGGQETRFGFTSTGPCDASVSSPPAGAAEAAAAAACCCSRSEGGNGGGGGNERYLCSSPLNSRMAAGGNGGSAAAEVACEEEGGSIHASIPGPGPDEEGSGEPGRDEGAEADAYAMRMREGEGFGCCGCCHCGCCCPAFTSDRSAPACCAWLLLLPMRASSPRLMRRAGTAAKESCSSGC